MVVDLIYLMILLYDVIKNVWLGLDVSCFSLYWFILFFIFRVIIVVLFMFFNLWVCCLVNFVVVLGVFLLFVIIIIVLGVKLCVFDLDVISWFWVIFRVWFVCVLLCGCDMDLRKLFMFLYLFLLLNFNLIWGNVE